MATLTQLHNIFDRSDKTISNIKGGLAVFHYLKDTPQDYELVVSLNAIIIEEYTIIVKEDDHLAFVIIPQGGHGGGKNVLRVVAMIALSVAVPSLAGYAAQGLMAAGVQGVTYGMYLGLQAGIMVAGGMLINTLLPPPVPKLNTNRDLEKTSPTYSFSGSSNARQAGSTLPIMLGVARVAPPIIGSYLSLDGDKQYLNLLMALNDGLVDDIHSIEINKQAIKNYENCTYEIRKGENNQSLIPGFRDTQTTFNKGVLLNDIKTTTYTTSGNSIDELEIVINLPKGLFYVKENGDYEGRTIRFDIEYKKTSNTSYIKQTKTISSTYKTTKRFSYVLRNLGRAKYDIKITRISSYDTNTRVANDLQFEYVNEIVYDDFIYPNVALLSVKALATDQLNGSFPQITCMLNNTKTRDNTKPLNNPAWACYELLKRENIPNSDINLREFEKWSKYCHDEGFTCNLYLDSQQELQSALNMVSILGRATVVQMGSTFTPIVSNVVDIPTQGFLFTSGNINSGTFELSTIPYDNRANVVEVTYYDEKDNYNPKTIQATSKDFDSTTKEIKSSINLYGCTKKEIAQRYAQFLINQNRYISQTISFAADVDSIACMVGDVIKVGVKYMTNSLGSGRLKEVKDKKIIFDQEFTLKKDMDYELQIRLEDDSIKCLSYTSTEDETTDALSFNNIPIIANPLNVVFSFGEQKIGATNLYRVTNISRANDMQRKITAIEYNANVYDDKTPITLDPVLFTQDTKNVKANELLIQRSDGGVDEILFISWQGGKLQNKIYLDDKYLGSTSTNSYEIRNILVRNQSYKIKVNDKEISYTFKGRFAPVEAVKVFNANLNDTATILTWQKVDFANGYRLYHNEQLIEDKIVATTYNYKLLKAGIHEFKIEALNLAGEASLAKEIEVSVKIPLDPIVNITYDGENIVLKWNESNSTYSIKHYIIKYDDIKILSKTTSYQTKVSWKQKDISIQAVDINDNVSNEIIAKSIIDVPIITNLRSETIDNNILFFWEYIKKTLLVKEVEIRVGNDFGTSKLAGFNSNTFVTFFENEKGTYKYWFTPIDSAGNKGESKSIVSFVNEPPDYILNLKWYSKFNALKNNAIVEDNSLLMGINTNETWQEHFVNNNFNSIAEQINQGYEHFLQPNLTNSYYEEIFDYGSVLPFTGITIILDYKNYDNNHYSIYISTSKDKKSWEKYPNTFKIFANNFQFVKVRLSSTSGKKGFLQINELQVKLDSKLKSEAGKGVAYSSDENGTLVNIKEDFIDITSLTVTAKGNSPKTAIYDFKDIPHAKTFKVFIFDLKGGRTTSEFSYSIKGY